MFKAKARFQEWLNNRIQKRLITIYVKDGRIPWSYGYTQYREQYISNVLADNSFLTKFLKSEMLPSEYGLRLDERCIEYPWVLSHLSPGIERCLDAGSAINHFYLLKHPILKNKKIHILTLAPESQSFWRQGISYLYEDMRHIPIQNDFYDTVICISCLEHVGFDNSIFVNEPSFTEANPNDFIKAVKELWRVLKNNGKLFLTLPYGVYSNFGTFQQFDLPLIRKLEHALQAKQTKIAFYKYNNDGWQISDAEDCAESEYYPLCMLSPKQRNEYIVENYDGAAAARAVACMQLIK